MTIESMVSESSVTATARSIAIAVSSKPEASETVTEASSATAPTLIENSALDADHSSPSLALNAKEVEPDQFASGSKINRPDATASPGTMSPAATATPSSRRCPFFGSVSTRKKAVLLPSSTSQALSEIETGVSSKVATPPASATFRSFTASTRTVTVSDTVRSSPFEASRAVTLKVTSKSVSWLSGGVIERFAVSQPSRATADPSAIAVRTPSVRVLPSGTPTARTPTTDSLSSVSVYVNGSAIE